MSADQVVHSFDVMGRLHLYHQRVFMKYVHPFLGVPVIHQVILQNEGIPAITLVEI